MLDLGRILVALGLLLLIVGLALWAAARWGFRGLPGDIHYQGQNFRLYFPVITCLALSVLLTLGLWLWHWLSRR